jgi:hypothetical protein
MAVSRLVHPTALGHSYAVRVREWPNGARQLIPAQVYDLNPLAYVLDENANWLLPADVPQIGALLAGYDVPSMPARVKNALWQHELASRSYYIDQRWPTLVTALEALVHVRGERLLNGRHVGTMKAFVDRLIAMRRIDPCLEVSDSTVRAWYDRRSDLAHGSVFGSLDTSSRSLYRSLEEFTRRVLRSALTERPVSQLFSSDSSIQQAFPLR